jgi:hypothetical protein
MMKFILTFAVVVTVAVTLVWAQQPAKKAPLSPPAETSVTIAGKALSIKYSAPSLRGRQIFGEGGQVSKDSTYPVWRAGANAATALHTEADLTIKGRKVPKGDYTVFVLVNVKPWQLIINKQIGQWGLAYDAKQDLVRIPMDMSKPRAPIETYKMTLSSTGAKKGKLQLEWDTFIASVPFTVK